MASCISNQLPSVWGVCLDFHFKRESKYFPTSSLPEPHRSRAKKSERKKMIFKYSTFWWIWQLWYIVSWLMTILDGCGIFYNHPPINLIESFSTIWLCFMWGNFVGISGELKIFSVAKFVTPWSGPTDHLWDILIRGTVGQDVDELICQSERKMQQNATFYLWPLLSLKLDFFLIMVPKNIICCHFFLKVSP